MKNNAAIAQRQCDPFQRVGGGSSPTSPLQLKVERCELQHIRAFVISNHYSESVNGVTGTFHFRVVFGDKVVGAAIFGRPAGMGVALSYCPPGGTLVELRRFCMLDEAPRNSESRCIGVMLRMLRAEGITHVLSYADPTHGHEGTIYKATGFVKVGTTGKQTNFLWRGKLYPRRNVMQTTRPFHLALREAVQSGEAVRVVHDGKHIFLKQLTTNREASAPGTRSLGCIMREKTKMSDIVKRTEQLPADFGASLMKGIEQTRSTLSTGGGGKPFMRLSRAGEYIYGPQNIDVQQGSHWAVNLAGLEHGWVCWGDGELLGQIMCSVQLPLPVRPAAIEGYAFEGQWGMGLACVKGDDKGLEVVYKNNSLGFRKAFDKLLADIRSRYVIDQQFYWPVIELLTSDYPHKKYGKIFEPIFQIVGWADAEGQLQTAKPRAIAPIKPEPAPEPAAEPAGEPAAAPRVGQRRRPAAR